MSMPGGEQAVNSVDAPNLTASLETSLIAHPAHDALLSPSIKRTPGDNAAAFELKFLISSHLASEVQAWALHAMQLDAYAVAASDNAYQTTTLYLDTPQRDVFHRSPGHRARKYRLRRYGLGTRVYLERKTRRGDRVAKQRCDVALTELAAVAQPAHSADWPGAWFCQRIHSRALVPSCRITYDRTAFVKLSDDGPLRLTFDRRIRGVVTNAWDLAPLEQGHNILTDDVICEFKFRGGLPFAFKEIIQSMRLEAGSVSKYRRMLLATGLAC